MTTTEQQNYGADAIQVLEGLEAVRKRPGMYIGSTGPRDLHHLVYEIVDNSVDEALAGYCDTINVKILEDGGVEVKDNGRGIPVDMHPTEGKSTVEVVLTVLHAGGKFGGGGYAVSGGLHGVGSSVVNALSERFEVSVDRQGYTWSMDFTKSVPNAPLAKGVESDKTGTTVRFWPSADIFEQAANALKPPAYGGCGNTAAKLKLICYNQSAPQRIPCTARYAHNKEKPSKELFT